MNTPFFSCEEARKLDMVDYLQSLGFTPQKVRNNDYWYLSPLRQENTPSFKINRKLNAWFDFGSGEGGNIIDFGVLYHHCSVKELLEKLEVTFSFHPQTVTVQQPQTNAQNPYEALEPTIKVLAATPISNPSLCRYLESRKIPLELANKYCKQVDFEMHGRHYFAIGFQNNADGYELRNQYFKGSSSPKDVTEVNFTGAREVAVFEGFFSFLSYLGLEQNREPCLTNFLVLNSLSFFEKSRGLMEKHEAINLYLDRDQAGIRSTARALEWDQKYTDKSGLYKNHKDLNNFLFHQQKELQQSRRFKTRL